MKVVILIPGPDSARSAYLKAAELAVAEVNAHEGRQGLQLLLSLHTGDPLQRKNMKDLRDLVSDKRVLLIMGKLPYGTILPVAGLAREKGIPFLAFPQDFIEAGPTGVEPQNLFWMSPSPESFQRAAVRLAAQFPQKKFYFLGRDSASGRAWGKYFWEELKRLKPDAEPAGEILLFGRVDNYGPYIQGILSAKTEACFSHLGPQEWPRFAKMARQQGYFQKVIHFELESGSLESLLALKKDMPEGVWGVTPFPFWALEGEETRSFVSKFKEKMNAYPDLDALSGYASIQALVAAVKKAGSLAPDKIMQGLEGLTFGTPVGPLSFRVTDHRVLWPIWGGSTRFVSGFAFPVLGDLKAFGPDSFYPGKTERKVEK